MRDRLVVAQARLDFVDPHDCTDVREERSIHESLFDALVTRDASLRIVPRLARAWRVSDDVRTWTFELHDGVRFHNGEPCDAEAVKFSLERMADPAMGATLGAPAVYAQYLGGLQVRVIDRLTVAVTTVEPLADLLDILADGYILPPRAASGAGADFATQPVGTGPYRLESLAAGDHAVLRANPDYFRGQATLREVRLDLVASSAERVARLNVGAADLISRIDPADAAQILALRLSQRDTTCIIYLLNCAAGPMQDARVRRAVNHAVDTAAIIRAVQSGEGEPLVSFVPPAFYGADPVLPPYRYDPGAARRLLREASVPEGLAITLLTPDRMPSEALAISERVSGYLRAVGLDARVAVETDRTRYANNVRLKQIGDLCCFDSSPLSTFRILREKASAVHRGSWWQGYDSPRIDALLAQASSTIDPADREALYRECYRIVHADAPWLFLYNRRNLFGAADWLNGWQPRADSYILPYEIP